MRDIKFQIRDSLVDRNSHLFNVFYSVFWPRQSFPLTMIKKWFTPQRMEWRRGKNMSRCLSIFHRQLHPSKKKKKLQHRPFCFHSILYRHQHVVIKNITPLADNGRSICNRRGFMKYEILAEQLITKQ